MYLAEISWFEESLLTRRQSTVRLIEASSKEIAEQVVRAYVDSNMKNKTVKIIIYDTLRLNYDFP